MEQSWFMSIDVKDIKTVSVENAEMSFLFTRHVQHTRVPTWDNRAHMHAHSHCELLYVLDGVMDVTIADSGRTVPLRAGQLQLISPNVMHSAEAHPPVAHYGVLSFCLKKRKCDTSAVDLYGALEEALNESQSRVFDLTAAQLDELSRLNTESNESSYCSHAVAANRAAGFVIGLFNANAKSAELPVANSFHRTCLIALGYFADSFLNDCFYTNATVTDLASVLHMSVKQTGRTLKKLYGMGYSRCVLRLRMACSSMLLRASERSISEIAETVGYRSLNHFYKSFRDYYACTPQKYRNGGLKQKDK